MEKSKTSTFILLLSALIIAAIFAMPSDGRTSFIMWLIYRVGAFADTLFHELGHSIFAWLYGIPTIPAVLTIMGSDQASGVSMPLSDRSMILQGIAIIALFSFCARLRKVDSYYFYPFSLLFIFIVLTAFTGYHSAIISYMGHGGSVLAAGILLFKAFSNVNIRNSAERWLNAVFGFFLILDNFFFSYELIFDAYKKFKYTSHQAFGVSHNDFVSITHEIPALSVEGIAWFTIFLCVFMVSIAAYLAYLLHKENEFLTMEETEIKLDEKPVERNEDLSNF